MKYIKPEDVSKITNYLIKYKDEVYNYEWSISDLTVNKLNKILNQKIKLSTPKGFNGAVQLKEILGKTSLLNHEKYKEISEWIVKDWGGIHRGNNEKLFKLVENFKIKNEVTFERISSISKIISFDNPQKYVIYDSRVAYAINWVIQETEAGNKFFPIAPGRSFNLKKFYTENLACLDRKKNIKEKKNLFIPKDDTYYEFNKLICKINKIIYPSKEPFYTEMLLFGLANKFARQ